MIEKYSDDLKKIEKIGDYTAIIIDLYNSISDDSKEELTAEISGDIENTIRLLHTQILEASDVQADFIERLKKTLELI